MSCGFPLCFLLRPDLSRINYIVVSTCIRVMYAYVMDDISAALCLEACHSSHRRCVCIVAYHL